MKKIWSIFLLLALCFDCRAPSAITYKRNRGRFGDDLYTYARAKLISLKYNIPLLFKPIHHSHNLHLKNEQYHYQKGDERRFKKVIPIRRNQSVNIDPNADVLYVSEFCVATDLYNEKLFAALKKMIIPTIEIKKLSLPNNKLTVGMHIRTGGGFDTHYNKQYGPLKFPQFEFYTKQLQYVVDTYPDQYLYVYIFTDDRNPDNLAKKLCDTVSSEKITYDFRKKGNVHNENVLDDFFNMMHFDILIHPRSGFSIFAQLLGYNKIAISPSRVNRISRDKWVINEVEIKTRQDERICTVEKKSC